MTTQISLNGNDWQFKEFHGADWIWRRSIAPDTRDTRWWRNGTVPGSVQHDLWMSGEIENPYYEKNSVKCEWVPQRTWVYKKTFRVREEYRDKNIQIAFLGVDYSAQFYLNGEYLGEHTGMFTPVRFDIREKLNFGSDNLIAVVIEAAPQEQCQVGFTSRVHTHKSRMGYWWDFCPRMVHLGIWQDVVLEIAGSARIEDVFIHPVLNPACDQACINISLDLAAQSEVSAEVNIDLRYDGVTVASLNGICRLPPGKLSRTFKQELQNPMLWWPNGSGAQNLYQADICVQVGGEISHQRVVEFGIRRIELLPNEAATPDALPYTFVINGRKTYIKGWNWVPMDALYGVPRAEKLEHLLCLAQRAHVNMLRVWGGGLIEKEAFYAICDRLGILIWQEFIQSSSGIDNTLPADAGYMHMLVAEAEQIVLLKRNHPALAVWCGGNELQARDETPLDDSHPVLAALKDVVQRLGPGCAWLATSPTGRVFSNSLQNIQKSPDALHDVHGPWEYQGTRGQYELYNQGRSLFHSEFGVEGITNQKALDHVISNKNQWPVSLDDNPYWWHLGAWWVQRGMWDQVYGELGDVKSYLLATQFIQYDGLRYALEADRRRKYHNSGTLPWQFNEPYPMAACTSAVDYYGQPKPAYYAVAQAYEPVHISARFDGLTWAGFDQFACELWANNSLTREIDAAILTARLVGSSGKTYAEIAREVSCAANQTTHLYDLEINLNPVEGIFFLDVRLNDPEAGLLTQNRYVFTRSATLKPLLQVSETKLCVTTQRETDLWNVLVHNVGITTAMNIWLEDGRADGSGGFPYFEDNYFCLFPGEKCSVRVNWQGVVPEQRRLEVSGWNVPPEVVTSA